MDTEYMSREDAITEIIEYKLECLYDNIVYRDKYIEELFRYGFDGIENLTNSELVEMYKETFGENIILSDE
jgi:hypothetical protein